MSVAPKLSGRCFWGRRTKPNGPFVYSVVTSGGSNGVGNSRIPLSLVGNTYYERRFVRSADTTGHDTSSSASLSSSSSLLSLCAGDIVVKMGSAVPVSLRGRRIVDVTGIQTSFFDASERNVHARRSVDDVVHSMHMYDGHEVPELNRGVLAIGKLTVLCAFPVAGTVSLVVLENASQTLLKRRLLTYKSEEEGMQLVRVIAENCSAGAVRHGHWLSPVTRGDCVVGVRLQ